MNKIYADLHLATCESFTKQKIPLANITSTILSIEAYEPSDHSKSPNLMSEELHNAKSVNEIFIILKRHSSFYDFKVLAYMIEKLGNDDDRRNLQQYQEKITEFWRRRVFEVSPPIALELASKERKFAILVSQQLISTMSLGDIAGLKHKIASLLGLKASAVYMHAIGEE